MLAMLFLVLFAALAIGFYASVNTSVQIANNEQHCTKALLAADSGLGFIRYHLANVTLSPDTQPADVLAELYQQLSLRLDGTPNLGTHRIDLVGNTIHIPGGSDAWIPLDAKAGTGFRIAITESGGNLRCKVTGSAGRISANTAPIERTVKVDFIRKDLPTSAFDYAVASKGRIVMKKGSITGVNGVSTNSIATVMSARKTSPAITVSGGFIGGDIHVTGPGLVSVSGGSVGGSSTVSDILNRHTRLVDHPNFPTFDTSVFKPYATSTYRNGAALKNIRIPANTNPNFAGGAILQGIIYIESPNTVEFRGNTLVQGIIVFENKGSPAENKIDMRGNFTQLPVPPGPEYDALRSVTGVSIFAPTTSMVISGSVDSDLVGNVILGTFRNGGSADWTIEKGTLMTLDETGDSAVFDGKTVKFKSIGKNFKPSKGLKYDKRYIPLARTYQELY
jgi:hypothetical protein